MQILQLQTNDLIYDPVSRRIYASVPASAGPGLGNTITTINPFTVEIEGSVFVGSEPGPLAVSDDGQFLYVGLQGAGAVRRYHIPTATAGLQIPLGADVLTGPYFAEDIAVLPGLPKTIAVTRTRVGFSPRHEDVAIFDDDIMRPTTSWYDPVNVIEASESATRLYGYNNESTGFKFQKIAVSESGAEVVGQQSDLISGFFVDIEFEEGVIYSTSGTAIDPEALTLVGRYAAAGPVEADATLGKVFYLDGTALVTFDMATFVPTDVLLIEGIVGGTGSLIRWGESGLAFRTTGGQVFLIGAITTEPQNPVCDVVLSNDTFRTGMTVIASLRLANPTTNPLSVEVKLWFDRPAEPPVPKTDLHPTGVLDLPAGYDNNFGAIASIPVTSDTPRGHYAFSCRIVDPITGRHLAEDLNPFFLK